MAFEMIRMNGNNSGSNLLMLNTHNTDAKVKVKKSSERRIGYILWAFSHFSVFGTLQSSIVLGFPIKNNRLMIFILLLSLGVAGEGSNISWNHFFASINRYFSTLQRERSVFDPHALTVVGIGTAITQPQASH